MFVPPRRRDTTAPPAPRFASNVIPFPRNPSPQLRRFSPGERAAVLALSYAYPVLVTFEVNDAGRETAVVLSDDDREMATAYPIPGGVWATDEARNHIDTFRTPEALSAALGAHLSKLIARNPRPGGAIDP